MTKARWLVGVGAVIAIAALTAAALYFGRASVERMRANRSFSQAQQHFAAGDLEAGRAALRDALARDPWQQEARLALAELELSHERLEHAFLEFETLAELYPDLAAAWTGVARVWLAAGMAESAEMAATRAIDASVLEAKGAAAPSTLYLLRAQIREQAGRRFGAWHDAQRVLDAEPGNAEGKAIAERMAAALARPATPAVARPPAERFWPRQLGVLVGQTIVAIRQQNWSAAQERVDFATREYPGTMIGPWIAGVTAYSRGQFADAERHLLSALAVAPRSSRVATNLAGAWAKQKGPVYAGEQLLKLHERDPGFLVPLDIAATAYLEARQPAQAEQALQRGVAGAHATARAYRQLADYHRQLDHVADAMAVCARGRQLFPDDLELAIQEAELMTLGGDVSAIGKAVGAFEKILEKHPDALAPRVTLARMLGQPPAALPRDKALKLARDLAADQPRDAQSLDAIGWLLFRYDEVREAKPWLVAAVNAEPNHPALRYHLGAVLAALKDKMAARTELQAALAAAQPFAERPDAQRLLNDLGG